MRYFLTHKLLPIVLVLLIGMTGNPPLSGAPSLPADAAGTVEAQPLSLPAEAGAETVAATPEIPSAAPEPTPTPTATPEPTPTPTPAPERFVLHMVGDCTLATVPAYAGSSVSYEKVVGDDYAYPFAEAVAFFRDDDFTFANLECTLTESNAAVAKTFNFKADPAYAKIMTEGSVEMVTLANNHTGDYGSRGLADTEAALDAEGVRHVGRDQCAVFETERGLRIGVYAASFASAATIRAGVAAVRAMEPDFVIAALHWGTEGSYRPNADQISCAHAAIDAGADFVYGSHPHTIQPVEEYDGRYIYYSFGNWTFGGNTNPRDKDSFILRLELEQDFDGTVRIISREHIPCAISGERNGNNYQPVPYPEDSEEYARVLSKLDGSFTGANLNVDYSYGRNE